MSFICNQVIDITHHSKRTQAGNLMSSGMNSTADEKDNRGANDSTSNVPVNVTIESAIEYYRNNATGNLANLYTFTADILDKYRLLSRKALNELKSQESSDVVEVNIDEVN